MIVCSFQSLRAPLSFKFHLKNICYQVDVERKNRESNRRLPQALSGDDIRIWIPNPETPVPCHMCITEDCIPIVYETPCLFQLAVYLLTQQLYTVPIYMTLPTIYHSRPKLRIAVVGIQPPWHSGIVPGWLPCFLISLLWKVIARQSV